MGYNLKRATVSGGPYTIIASNLTSLAYTNIGLANGTMYYFVVSGLNATGEGGNSAEAAARPISSATTAINASVNAGQIQITWPMDHTGWRLQMQTNSLNTGLGTNWVTMANSTNVNQISIPMDVTYGSVFYRMVYP